MKTQTLLLAFAVIVQFCNGLGRHNFYEYYNSRRHKGHSMTTKSTLLSTSDIHASSEYAPGYPPDDYFQKDKRLADYLQKDFNKEIDDYFQKDKRLADNLQKDVYKEIDEISKIDVPSGVRSDDSSLSNVYFSAGGIIFLCVIYCLLRYFCRCICQPCTETTQVVIKQTTTQVVSPRTTATCQKIPESRRFVSGNQANAGKKSDAKAAKESQAKAVKDRRAKIAKESQAKTTKESGENSRVVPQQTPATSQMIRQSPGSVTENQTEAEKGVAPQQTPAPDILMIHQPPELQQPYTIQRFDERSQFFPPQYQPQFIQQFSPMQQFHQMQQFPPTQPQFQYSPPAMQSPNPPEAPPPYEFPEKF